jgi:hypothetical protein
MVCALGNGDEKSKTPPADMEGGVEMEVGVILESL